MAEDREQQPAEGEAAALAEAKLPRGSAAAVGADADREKKVAEAKARAAALAAAKAQAPKQASSLPPELEQLKELVVQRLPDVELDPSEEGAVAFVVPRERLVEVCRALRDWPETRCNYLACLSGVDYPAYIEVVYHVTSLETPAMFAVKARAPKDDCRLPSVTGVWAGANWHEREVFDLLGVTFEGHPDLRRILLPEGFSGGYPLRKDFVDRRPPRERRVRLR